MDARDDRTGRMLLYGAGLLLAYAAARVLLPQIAVLAASAIVAVVVEPLYARLLARMPGRPNAAAAVAVAAVGLLLAVPLAVGGWYLIRECIHAFPLLKEQIQALSGPAEGMPSWVPALVRDPLQDMNVKTLLLDNITGVGAGLGQFLRATAGNAAVIALDGLVFVLSLFLFLRDGRRALARLLAAVPLTARSKARIVGRTHDMVIATIQGVFAVAVLQGTLAVAGFSLFGVRFPVLLGALCMIFSPIPFLGSALVWVPVVARIALAGELGRAALAALWFGLVVGTADNVLRPILIGSRSRLPAAIVVVGVLGGVRAFGVIGTFLGPVIMAMAVAVVDTLFLAPDRDS